MKSDPQQSRSLAWERLLRGDDPTEDEPPGEHHAGTPDWAAPAIEVKEMAVASFVRGDLPPVIVVKRRSVVEAILFAPRVDKQLGLQAARLARRAFDADELILAFEVHFATAGPDETLESFRERFPPGRMQEMCDNEGACATGLITDAVWCCRITTAQTIETASLPYDYHGRPGPPLRWLPDAHWDRGPEGMGGMIATMLARIMEEPPLADEPEVKYGAEFLGLSDDRRRYATAIVAMKMLATKGFLVSDMLTGSGPGYEGSDNDILDRVMAHHQHQGE